jgi:hypothetical protein
MTDWLCEWYWLSIRRGLFLYLTDEFNLQKTSTFTLHYKRFSVCESWLSSSESLDTCWIFHKYCHAMGSRSGAVCWGTALKAGRSRIWFPIVSLSFQPHWGPAVDSACNRNKYQEYFLGGESGRCVRLKSLPLSCANFLEIWEPQTPGTLRACPGLFRDCFNLYWQATLIEIQSRFSFIFMGNFNGSCFAHHLNLSYVANFVMCFESLLWFLLIPVAHVLPSFHEVLGSIPRQSTWYLLWWNFRQHFFQYWIFLWSCQCAHNAGVYLARFLDLSARWRWTESFISCRFRPREGVTGKNWAGVWLAPVKA